MKFKPLLWCAAGFLVALTRASAATHYVDAASTNAVPPFSNWTTAAANIQDAVDAAAPGDEIVVTNGVYQTGARAVYGMSNRVAVTKPVTVRSVNGPAYTSIVGHGPIGENAIRCVYMTNGAVLSGFTLTNGATQVDEVDGDREDGSVSNSGGGVWCMTRSAVVTNCVLAGNSAHSPGGGAFGTSLINCTLMRNSAAYGAGSAGSTLNNCILTDNFAADSGGGAVWSTLNNCTVAGNTAALGYGGGAAWSALSNCTVIGNSAHDGGGGVWTFEEPVNNCIVYHNDGGNYTGLVINYSCTTPAPSSGLGNITAAPLFVDTNGWSNLRLQSNSPCINAGNNAYVTTSTDLDGRARVVGGTVDIGAYEWQGTIRYVSAASTNPIAPYSSWEVAAVTIQDAVDAAVDGDEIVVTNGVYQTGARAVYGMSNRVAVTKPLTVRSVNGPDVTSIVGYGPNGDTAIRCAYLTNGAALVGFTLTNGATQRNDDPWVNLFSASGGGVWCEFPSAVISNCVLTGNSAYKYGGAAYQGTLNNCTFTSNRGYFGGAAYGSTLNNCTLTGNRADTGGAVHESTLNNCTVTRNIAEGGGGAAFSTLINCMVTENTAAFGGGGVVGGILSNCTLERNFAAESSGGGAYAATLNNCIVTGNSAGGFGGGGAFQCRLNGCTLTGNSAENGGGACYGTLTNCVVTGNLASEGYGGGTFIANLFNCTLAGNSANDGGGAYGGALNNCIVYYNAAPNGPNYDDAYVVNSSCTTPDLGIGNITNAPLFVDTNGWSNLRLQSNSPCINAGNNAYVTTATDLDGLPRIAGGTVDIGAYEFQSPASTISYAWLQQSGLPTDGSADYMDTDHDGHNNRQEWMTGTEPMNALSALRLAPPVITPTNVTLIWTSVTNRTYTLVQATNLSGAPAFSVLRSNVAGLPGTTSWTDTNAPVSSPRFYRLRVSP